MLSTKNVTFFFAIVFLVVCALCLIVAPRSSYAQNTLKGDVNNSGSVNIVDAQLAYDLATTTLFLNHCDYETMLLRADVNEDGAVFAEDAYAIQHYALTGDWEKAQTDASEAEEKNRNAAYYQKCQEYALLYGNPSSVQVNTTVYTCGLSFARLIDMDGDGKNELILSYQTFDNPATTDLCVQSVEVWSYRNNMLTCDYRGKLSQHGSNGFFPYLEIVQRNDTKGAAIIKRCCYGSAPLSETYDVFGYKVNGSFGCLGGRAMRGYGSAVEYYLASEGTGNAWMPSVWKAVDANTYETAFSFIDTSNPLYHMHFFSDRSVPFDTPTESMEQMLATTRSVISQLASVE